MKKLSLYLMALLSLGFAACDDDYATETGPQAYGQQSLLKAGDVSVATGLSNIVIADYIDEVNGDTPITIGTVSVKEGAMPENSVLQATVEFATDADFQNVIAVSALDFDETNAINVSPTVLEDAYFNNITRNPATQDLYVRTILYTLTDGESAAYVGGQDGVTYFDTHVVTLTPINKVHISPAYYVIGAAGGWSADGARTQKFQHSDADVYADPIFSVIIDAGGDDCWFAIGDDEALAAVEDGDWSKLFGTKGESEDLTGTMDYRYNLGGDHSFHVQNAKKIRITLNMLEYSYTIEPVNIAENYYLIGGPGEWNNSKEQKFSHSSKDVFEDPVFTYTFAGTGSDMWFAFGDEEAIDAVGEGVWNKLFGTTGASEDLSGTFDRRYNLDGDHSFHVDGKAKYYRFSVNMADMTYTITTLDFEPYVYFIGATDGWANAEQKLALTDENGIYTGYLYVADPNGWGVEFKFQKVAGSWDEQYNSNNLNDITGDFAKTGDNIAATAGEGVYYVTLNLVDMTLNGVKVEKMGIIGDFNGWGGDVEMTWNATDYCFEATGAGVTTNGWKFRVNSDWAINLGSNDNVEPSAVLNDLVANGKNIGVAGNTIKLYPTRKTSGNIFCTVE